MTNVKIRDVGHGNWNEVTVGDTLILFDFGAQLGWDDNKIRHLIDRAKFPEDKNIIIVISHWDVDHYQCLLQLNDKELSRIKTVIGPQIQSPINKTLQRVVQRLHANRVPFYEVPPINRVSKGREIQILPLLNCFSGTISLYRSTRTKNRNLDSIVLVRNYTKSNTIFVFTGDQDYFRIEKFILRNHYKKKRINMVLPHHGGNANKLEKFLWDDYNICQIAISYNKINRYKHPKKMYTEYFKRNACFYNSTNGKGDILYL